MKADRSPVTEADRAAERAIVGVLRVRCPDHGVLGEELGEAGPRARRFIIDPIDGTRNFVRRIPTWAVMIGLEEEGVVTAGAIFQPVTGVLHTAWRGQGAFRDGERIRVSRVDALDRALVVHSSLNFLRRSRYWDGFLNLVDRTQVQRGFGDYSAYLWVAEGQGEIALSTTVKAWDVAAIKVIVEEAGGRLTSTGTRDLRHHRARQQRAAPRGAGRDARPALSRPLARPPGSRYPARARAVRRRAGPGGERRGMGRYWLGIDIGGTFTDFKLYDTTSHHVTGLKVASTPPDFARAVEDGLDRLAGEHGIDLGAIDVVVHGTTIAVNTLIQRTGARLGLLVTEGFRDILEIQRLRLPNPLDLYGGRRAADPARRVAGSRAAPGRRAGSTPRWTRPR